MWKAEVTRDVYVLTSRPLEEHFERRRGLAVVACSSRDEANGLVNELVKPTTTDDLVEVALRRPGTPFVTWDKGETWEVYS